MENKEKQKSPEKTYLQMREIKTEKAKGRTSRDLKQNEMLPRRPRSASSSCGGLRERERGGSACQRNTIAADRYSAASNTYTRSRSCSKSPTILTPKHYTNFLEFQEPVLCKIVANQKEILDLLRLTREEYRKKLSKSENKKKSEGSGGKEGKKTALDVRGNSAVTSYSNNLEEVFQAWINLIYFVINLRINVIRVANASGMAPFKPNALLEKNILVPAIEAVTLYSKLKMKGAVDSLKEMKSSKEHKLNNKQILDYEEKIFTPFILDMDFLEKKVRELLDFRQTDPRPMSSKC